MKFLCDQCKAKYQIADDKIAGKTVRMKCRKCGHQIEVRAAVTETSVGDAKVQPAAPRPLATSLAAARPSKAPAPSPESTQSALAGAFKNQVQKDDEVSASFDLGLSPGDEWYVAINGVPVGPIRVQELRRKAALGAVTGESLVWQEGLEEWRPVKAFAELAAIVDEAAVAARTSLITPEPPPAGASPSPPRAAPKPPKPGAPAPARPPTSPPRAAPKPGAPAAPSPSPPRASPPSPGAPPQPGRPGAMPAAAMRDSDAAAAASASRNNVVPINSRLATAEKLEVDDATVPFNEEPIRPSVAPDPFAMPAASASMATSRPPTDSAVVPAVGMSASAVPAPATAPDSRARKPLPWMLIGMLVMFAAFGITAGLAIAFRPPQAIAPVVIQMSAMPVAPTGAPTGDNNGNAAPESSNAVPQASNAVASKGPTTAASAKAAPTVSSTAGGFALSGLGGSGPKIGASEGSGSEAPKSGQCLTQSQVQGVINQHQPGVKRGCWDRNPSSRSVVSISVMCSIGPGGEVQSATASGEDPSVARCVENDVRGWRFPAGGCVQQTAFGFRFLRQ